MVALSIHSVLLATVLDIHLFMGVLKTMLLKKTRALQQRHEVGRLVFKWCKSTAYMKKDKMDSGLMQAHIYVFLNVGK